MGTTDPSVSASPAPLDLAWLQQSYDDFPRIEAAFNGALTESLHPRGPDLLYDPVADMNLPTGAVAVDVGSGEGRHTLLAERFGLSVIGLDPVPRHIELAAAALGSMDPDARRHVQFRLGSVEALPIDDGTACGTSTG